MKSIQNYDWYTEMGWTRNPFSLDIYPELFVGHENEIKTIKNSIKNNQKFILITGPTGIGKTTFLKWITTQYDTVYIPKPPIDEKELVTIFKNTILKKTIIEKIIAKLTGEQDVNIYNLAEMINKHKKNKQLIFIVDEAHETSLHVLEWLRTLTDHIENSILILSGLRKLKTDKLNNIETLDTRINVNVQLSTLTKNESVKLVKKRIESVGGQNINPFTLDTISEIYTICGGFPRETIKICNKLILNAINTKSMIIDNIDEENENTQEDKKQLTEHTDKNNTIQMVNKEQREQKSVLYHKYMTDTNQITRNSIDMLTKKQRDIINILSNKPATPTNIINIISLKEYKTKNHALRSINNILRRLVDSGYITRERQGKAYIYKLTPKVKVFLIDN
ncbi:MAG: AAA family ATPase [DPANN group archaeon]|nr:AAA family ATPase [DPANN group archaeon]